MLTVAHPPAGDLGSNRVLTTPYLETMANSDEWLTTIVTMMYADTLGRVLDLYQTLLKRNPDPTGWHYWTAQVLTTGDINLANSQEHQLRAEARF